MSGAVPPRPGFVRWLGYAFGMGLPERYREWILHDTTGPTWIVRHIARALVQLAVPALAVLVLLPAPTWVRVLTVIAAGGPALMFSIGYIVETSEHRLIKAGYPGGLGESVRRERAARAQREQAAARRQRIAERAAKRWT